MTRRCALLLPFFLLFVLPACQFLDGPSSARMEALEDAIEFLPVHASNAREQASVVHLVFSEPMDVASVESALSLTPQPVSSNGGRGNRRTAVGESFVWSEDKTNLTYRPDGDLVPETEYTVRLDAGARTRSGQSLSMASKAFVVPTLKIDPLTGLAATSSFTSMIEPTLAGSGASLNWNDASALNTLDSTTLVVPIEGAVASVMFTIEASRVVGAALNIWFTPDFPVCHSPPGNPSAAHTIFVGAAALTNHLVNHGDQFGPCVGDTSVEHALVFLGPDPAGGRATYDETGQLVMTASGRSAGTSTLEELTTFTPLKRFRTSAGSAMHLGGGFAVNSTATDSAVDDAVTGFTLAQASDPDGISEEDSGTTCSQRVIQEYEAAIGVFEGYLADAQAELEAAERIRNSLQAQVNTAATNLSSAKQKLDEANAKVQEASDALEEAEEAHDEAVEALEGAWYASLGTLGGGTASCGTGLYKGFAAGAKTRSPLVIAAGVVGGGVVGCILPVVGWDYASQAVRTNTETIVTYEKIVIPRAEETLAQRTADQAEAAQAHQTALDDKTALDAAFAAATERVNALSLTVGSYRWALADLRTGLEIYRRENCL